MDAKHTPGPWINHGRIAQSGLPHSAVAAKTLIARVYSEAFGDSEQEAANARLIAAAPEMLAEVESLYTELADFENNWPGRDTGKGQYRLIRLRTLLAKATGRTEQEVQDDYGTRAARARAGA